MKAQYGPTEAEFLRTILECAHLYGWRVAHFRPARRLDKDGKEQWRTPVAADGAGFPDLLLVHAQRHLLVLWEVKSEIGLVSPSQAIWLRELAGIPGIVSGVVWPPDWERIKNILSGEE